jgi:hypothetical protein
MGPSSLHRFEYASWLNNFYQFSEKYPDNQESFIGKWFHNLKLNYFTSTKLAKFSYHNLLSTFRLKENLIFFRCATKEANRLKLDVSALRNISAKSLCSWTGLGPQPSLLVVPSDASSLIAADSSECSVPFPISWRETCCSTTAMCRFSFRIFLSPDIICTLKWLTPLCVLYNVQIVSLYL